MLARTTALAGAVVNDRLRLHDGRAGAPLLAAPQAAEVVVVIPEHRAGAARTVCGRTDFQILPHLLPPLRGCSLRSAPRLGRRARQRRVQALHTFLCDHYEVWRPGAHVPGGRFFVPATWRGARWQGGLAWGCAGRWRESGAAPWDARRRLRGRARTPAGVPY